MNDSSFLTLNFTVKFQREDRERGRRMTQGCRKLMLPHCPDLLSFCSVTYIVAVILWATIKNDDDDDDDDIYCCSGRKSGGRRSAGDNG